MLNNAFALLRPWVADLTKDGKSIGWSDRFQSLQQNYQYMVDYYLSGKEDPKRSEVTHSLIREAYILLDEVYLEKQLRESLNFEFIQMHAFAKKPVSPRVASKDDVAGPPQVFRFFWLCKRLEEFDLDVLSEYVADEQMEEEALMGISGLTLNILRCFSEAGMLRLIDICAHADNTSILERAWVSLELLLLHYDSRLHFFPAVEEAFLDLLVDEDAQGFAQAALASICNTRGVGWASQSYYKLQTNLFRYMSDQATKKNKNGSFAFISMDDLDEFGKGLTDDLRSLMHQRSMDERKLRQMSLDVNFAIYQGMYQTAFFREPFHWFLPFDLDYLPTERERKIAEQIEDKFSDDVCDSDRFALIATMATFEGDEIPASLVPARMENLPTLVCNNYTKQLYRFFTINPWNMQNLFGGIFELISTSTLLKMLRPSAQDKIRMADQIFECHDYQIARIIYSRYADVVNTKSVWRNLGYCYQKEEMYDLALEAYDHITIRKANASNEWILRQKAWCLMHKDVPRYDDACQVIDMLLQYKPEETVYLYEKGKCLEHMELYMEALDLYYKLDILQPNNRQVLRSIAWCSFISGQMEQARSYYEKLKALPSAMQMVDYLNYGHYYFVQGERMEAYQYYVQALRMCDTIKVFLKTFRPDRRILLEKGIPTPDIYLMEDQLIAASRQG